MLRAEVYESIQMIGEEQWSRLADRKFPFTQYHFLLALETSGSVGARTGWFPRIVTARNEQGLAGALVLYLKMNSYGEYIFDFAWADVHQRYGFAYYPKLTSAIPFTPATGSKILVSPGENAETVAAVLLEAVSALAMELKVSSIHHLFTPKSQNGLFEASDYHVRESFQFHWLNQDYTSFEDFLLGLRGKRRKEIRRERAQVAKAPVKIQRLTGDQIKAEHGELFYRFYLNTIDKRQSQDYLTEEFFEHVFKNMREQILLVTAALDDGTLVAGALYYFGDDTLFGRNWGCVEEFRSLHFELCYYQGIEFAIERKFKLFEAGAQGEHKFQRGFLPARTYSAHQIFQPDLSKAIVDHVAYEKKEIEDIFGVYGEHSPFVSPESGA